MINAGQGGELSPPFTFRQEMKMQMKAWSTKLQEYINQKLTEHEGFPEHNTPKKYWAYNKIRHQVSEYLGVVRPLGILEYYKAIEFVNQLFEENTHESDKSDK